MTAPAALPTWEGFLRPVLQIMSDGVERSNRELKATVAEHVGLTEDQQSEVLPSGQNRADNRIGWAMSFLPRAGALDRPRRGRYLIAATGQDLLQAHPAGLPRMI